jgi:hypothetical protein
MTRMSVQRGSPAFERARREVAAIAADLRAARERLQRVVLKLKRAAKSAEVVALHPNGERLTVEAWVAGLWGITAFEPDDLQQHIRELSREARRSADYWRREVRRHARETAQLASQGASGCHGRAAPVGTAPGTAAAVTWPFSRGEQKDWIAWAISWGDEVDPAGDSSAWSHPPGHIWGKTLCRTLNGPPWSVEVTFRSGRCRRYWQIRNVVVRSFDDPAETWPLLKASERPRHLRRWVAVARRLRAEEAKARAALR